MTIMASRPVRSTDRLIDAPTIPLPRPAVADDRYAEGYADGLHRAVTARPAVELGRQAWALLQRDGRTATFDRAATALGVDRAAVVTATAEHVRVTAEQRHADRAREAYEALTAEGTTFTTLTPIARRFGITATELVELAIEYADRQSGASVVARSMTACPTWCATTHRTVDEVLGNGLSHETTQTEITGLEPSWIDRPATLAAWVERCDEAGRVTEPARVVLTVAEGSQGHYPGSDEVRGWSGTVEQVEQLGRSLLALAQVVRAEQSAPAGAAYRVDVFTADDVLMTSRTVTAADDQAAEHAARRLVDELGGAAMAAVFTASLVYVGTVTA